MGARRASGANRHPVLLGNGKQVPSQQVPIGLNEDVCRLAHMVCPPLTSGFMDDVFDDDDAPDFDTFLALHRAASPARPASDADEIRESIEAVRLRIARRREEQKKAEDAQDEKGKEAEAPAEEGHK